MIVRRTGAGTEWGELAQGDPLAAVLDPADRKGGKNRAIDRVHKHALARANQELRDKDVLDFGCGTGRLSEWLVQHGARVVGVDATPEMVEVARKRVPLARFHTNEDSTLPFTENSFDLVIAVGVLQYYVRKDPSQLRHVTRVMRRRARLVAIEQVKDDDAWQGGTVQDYERMFHEAGVHLNERRVIRLSDSRIIALAQRYPQLARVPGLPWLVDLETRRTADLPFVDSRYADVLFVATSS